ncbi:MAG: threonylcarbamoyl-AMP synthase [Oscillospiraceae bacterium]|nr:threonylcarbamoyl-AMP synthase [Oscillospiraceae bacterium]
MMKTVLISSDDDFTYAAEVFLRGGLVALPTETVYGLAGNGADADVVAKIYEIKGRPAIKPLSLLVADMNAARAVCDNIPEVAHRLAEAFWPGPLTLVLQKHSTVPDVVTAHGDTVGVRCPNHPIALEFLRLVGVPAAAPSANISGLPSPKSAKDVLDYFDGRIDCIIDGGICALGVESTIVDLSSNPYHILRHGALPEEEIRYILG